MRKCREIQLASYEDLLGIHHDTDKVIQVKLSDLHSFDKHPFRVSDDNLMEKTKESIEKHGMLHPLLVRSRPQGGYEILSGHRRKRAAELAGFNQVPAIVKECTDDEAVVTMVDSNIQREHLLPSEKAFAYRMKMEALKHQGIRTADSKGTADMLGEHTGDSGRTVQRYIRLTYLHSGLLEMVDKGKVKTTAGFYLSYLKDFEQEWVFSYLQANQSTISADMANQLKKYSEGGKLTEFAVKLLLHKTEKKEKSILSERRIRQYFPENYSRRQMEKVICGLLEEWKMQQEKTVGGRDVGSEGKEKHKI